MTQERAQDIKGAIVAVVAFLTALWGWIGWAILLLALAMVVDYLTGSAAAKARGEWSSEVARAGLRHKLGEIVAVGAAAFADLGVRVMLHTADLLPLIGNVGWPDCFTLIVTLWYLFTEIGSIIENAGKLGARIPGWLSKGIAVLQNTAAKAGEVNDPGTAPVPETETPVVQGKHEKKTETTDPVETAAEPSPTAVEGWEIPHPETGGTATIQEIIADLKDAE